MLDLTLIMNSSMEDVLSTRCAAVHNQNLEIHVKNKGEKTLTIQHHFILENEVNSHRCDNLFPPWKQTISPGCATAFYCDIDENLWRKFETISFYDNRDNEYRFVIKEHEK